MEVKIGTILSMELPKEQIAELDDTPDEYFIPILDWIFLPNGLPNLLDLRVFLALATGSRRYEIDAYGVEDSVDKVAKIQELMAEVLATAKTANLWQIAKADLLKEMEEE